LSPIDSELRRRLAKVAGVFFLALSLPNGWALPTTVRSGIDRDTFAAFLDVLLPRDAHSGSATDLKVNVELLKFARHDERFLRLIDLGCTWLNMTGKVGFTDLPSTDQIRLVEWMSSSDWNEIPRRFYELVRQTAIEAYFSQPASLAGLPIRGSPQPIGYPPPWD